MAENAKDRLLHRATMEIIEIFGIDFVPLYKEKEVWDILEKLVSDMNKTSHS